MHQQSPTLRSFPGDIIVDVLINNAGIVFHPYTRTEDGLEKHLQVNYLGHFMLTHMLLSNMERSEDARIINVSAQAHTNGDLDLVDMNRETDNCYNKCFGQSKLALVMMAKYMSTLLKGTCEERRGWGFVRLLTYLYMKDMKSFFSGFRTTRLSLTTCATEATEGGCSIGEMEIIHYQSSASIPNLRPIIIVNSQVARSR